MNETTTAVATTEKRPPVVFSERGIKVESFESLQRFATCIAESGLAPKGISTPAAICVAIQMGAELGLPPMSALQNIAVINGRPSVWGDAQLGIVRASGLLDKFEEFYEFNGSRLPRNPVSIQDGHVAVCRVKRAGFEAAEVGFSVQDAKQAGLWGKDGPWKQYPARMMKYRARAFALRDQFGDLLRGLLTTEESEDIARIERMKPATAEVIEPKTYTIERQEPATASEAPIEVNTAPTQPTRQQPASEVPPAMPASEVKRLERKGNATATPQEQLASKLVSEGFSPNPAVDGDLFDSWMRAAIHLKLLPTNAADTCNSFAEVPVQTASRHLRVIPQLVAAMKADRGETDELPM